MPTVDRADRAAIELLRETLQQVAQSAQILAGRIETVEKMSSALMALLTARLEDLTHVVNNLAAVVLGKEDPEKSLTVTVAKLRQSVEALSTDLHQIETKSEGTARTDQNMRRDAVYKYLVWLAGIVTLLVAQGLFLVLKERLTH